MVIQHGYPIVVWGAAAAGSEITVKLGEHGVRVKTDAQGAWSAELPALTVTGLPLELTVSGDGGSKTFKDVLIGDVWLAAGQSNMVLALAASADNANEKKAAPLPLARVCKLPGEFAFAPAGQYSRALAWEPLNPQRIGAFCSAVAYYFARTVQPEAGLPLGVVQAAVGGTQAEQWTPEEALRAALPDNPLFAARERAREKQGAGGKVGIMESGAGSVFNGIIHPLRHVKFAGVLWYQGEANTRSKRDYAPVLTTLVQSWRDFFGEPELPWVIVQLPNFSLPKDDGWMRVREAQLLVSKQLRLPLVVTIDEGSAETIHPPKKDVVGRRAGLAALQRVYQKEVEGSSPVPKSFKTDGDSIVVEFTGFKGDLVVKGDRAEGFEIAGDDHRFYPATAQVFGRQVVVRAPEVPQPKAVRYLWQNSPAKVTLYNAAGFPVTPFRTEAWPDMEVNPLFIKTMSEAARP
ncbi:MAG: sialate O-acetylesterase [Verrucomicrobiales bacterium]|nr:sialate O-acetylesterase [Verrucomicrobiales bacterium]